MEYCIRISTCEDTGIFLRDIGLTRTEDGLRICGHMEAGKEYVPKPGMEPKVVGDLMDREERVLVTVGGWHQGIFSEVGFSTFTVYLDGRHLTGAGEWVMLYVTMTAGE